MGRKEVCLHRREVELRTASPPDNKNISDTSSIPPVAETAPQAFKVQSRKQLFAPVLIFQKVPSGCRLVTCLGVTCTCDIHWGHMSLYHGKDGHMGLRHALKGHMVSVRIFPVTWLFGTKLPRRPTHAYSALITQSVCCFPRHNSKFISTTITIKSKPSHRSIELANTLCNILPPNT